MTKEYILEYFKNINYAYNDCTRYDTLKNMLDELQEPCEDAISRKDALFAVRVGILSTATVYGRSEEGMATRREIEGALRAIPPVTPAEKVGHWIIYDVHGHKACKCSECNNDVGYPCTDKYCKYCGAKMQEVGE